MLEGVTYHRLHGYKQQWLLFLYLKSIYIVLMILTAKLVKVLSFVHMLVEAVESLCLAPICFWERIVFASILRGKRCLESIHLVPK